MVTMQNLIDVTAESTQDNEDALCRLANNFETCVLREAMLQAENGCSFCHFRPGDKSVEINVVDRLKESLRRQGFYVCDRHQYQDGGGIWFSWP